MPNLHVDSTNDDLPPHPHHLLDKEASLPTSYLDPQDYDPSTWDRNSQDQAHDTNDDDALIQISPAAAAATLLALLDAEEQIAPLEERTTVEPDWHFQAFVNTPVKETTLCSENDNHSNMDDLNTIQQCLQQKEVESAKNHHSRRKTRSAKIGRFEVLHEHFTSSPTTPAGDSQSLSDHVQSHNGGLLKLF